MRPSSPPPTARGLVVRAWPWPPLRGRLWWGWRTCKSIQPASSTRQTREPVRSFLRLRSCGAWGAFCSTTRWGRTEGRAGLRRVMRRTDGMGATEKAAGRGCQGATERGNRFVDELTRRDVVAAAMMRLPGRTAWLLLGRDAGTEYGTGALDFYCKRGLMRKAETLSAAAAAMGVPLEHLKGQLDEYARVAAGGDVDPYGKRIFPHPPDPDQQLPLYLARVTPVVHYTMGGVAINERAEVLRAGPGGAPDGSGATIKGLYAAGEVSGGCVRGAVLFMWDSPK
ncbi:hypothetical protein Vretimale_17518 [Volvox reticuliferus]|uniref:FAD-dependent oxidoreductase 2 FAD-binding domain-containing protein n=1 Tax=Volvox reticuliferus TaxID=1737510 RepID=A0A8J4GV15_9CHLO|nr:hypothetical protein Vretimale_17518 [Volvox reticuliferus]